jgi:demethylmenaquinone methyltransferase/2-methoxy-6-polyprenyl-1,4-benzoquinol methylase
VHRNFRGQGLGQAAFTQFQAEYFPPGARITLDVLANNPRGRRFWEKLGFSSHHENLRLEKRDLLQEQIAYYRARAGEYDEWFYRLGRYDRGPELNQRWFDEVKTVMEALHAAGPVDDVLELACGTGIWTEQLLKVGQQVTALDAAPEVIEINRNKLKSERVDYQQVDLFAWTPQRQYDLVFFSFWLSHVPPDKLDSFLANVAAATRPGGQIFIVDSQRIASSTAVDHPAYDPDSIEHRRSLNDGRSYTIYKVFYEVDALRETLAAAGFEAQVLMTDNYFIYAHGRRAQSA